MEALGLVEKGGAGAHLYRAWARLELRATQEVLAGFGAKLKELTARERKEMAESGVELIRSRNGGGILGDAAGFSRVWKAPSWALMRKKPKRRRKKGKVGDEGDVDGGPHGRERERGR